MIVDFVDLSINDDEVVIGEEHSFHVNGYSVDGNREIIDLTSEDDISEGEHVAHGQGDAAKIMTLPKQEFIADDGQAEPAQCAATLQRQEHREDDRQGSAAQCAVILQGQKLTADDGKDDTTQCATTMLRQGLSADDGHGDTTQHTTTLQRQVDFVDLSSNDDEVVIGEEHSVHVNAYSVDGNREIIELTSEDDISEGEHVAHGQGDAAQDMTLPKQEFIADDGQAEPAQCAATLQRQEHREDDRQGSAAQCAVILQGQQLTADDGQDDTTQCATTMLRQGLSADDGHGDTAQHAITLQRQELTSDDGHDTATQCITTLQRQELNSYDRQDTGAHAMLQRQESDLDYGHDVTQGTILLQRQESVTAHGQGNAAQCTITLQRQELLAVADSMQEAVQCENSAEATTSLSRTQGSYKTPAFFSAPHLSTEGPFSRQFWKAGEYRLAAQAAINNGQNCLRIHPKFLHSNATSHKWAFGAIAELLDNAIDEVANRATFVKIDKMKHSHDGDYSLVIQDNGGGMSPETLRCCMSFGFSQKCATSSIGQYGNGFKTSTMRLGADVIVFSCTQDDRRLTRSVGLLSYTFLMRTKCNDIFVPAVDYEFDAMSSTFKRIMNRGEKHFSSNLSTLLKWSPFSTEDELLNQFNNMEYHGTKIIVFNLWFNDASEMELDFVTDKEDILISGAPEIRAGQYTIEWLTQMHVASRFRYSLRVYASILYLHVPENFQIILCGRAVEPHCVVKDLIYRECIQYRPQVGVTMEVDAITTIGFLKGAPHLDIYGFNVYHKNRLILPFWPAGSCKSEKRGIAGVLEANFIRPTHDKQDFESTGLFQRLETRLKEMASEYWSSHCHLVGYTRIVGRLPPRHYSSTAADNDDDNLRAQATTNTSNCDSRTRASEALHSCSNGYNRRDPLHVGASMDRMDYGACPSTSINVGSTLHKTRNAPQQSQTELCKRRNSRSVIYWRAQKRRNTNVYSDQPGSNNGTEMQEETRALLHQNTMLTAECSGLEAAGEQLTSKADELQKELNVWQLVYKDLTDMWHRRRRHNNFGVGFI